MSSFNFKQLFAFMDVDGNLLPGGDYFYGPHASKLAAWLTIAQDPSATESTKIDFFPSGFKFGVITSSGVTDYVFVGTMPSSGWSLSDAKESSGGGIKPGSTVQTLNEGEIAAGEYNKSTLGTDEQAGTKFSVGDGSSNTERENGLEVLDDGTVYIKGVGSYDGTNPLPGSNDVETVIEQIETSAGCIVKTAAGGYKTPEATSAASKAFATGNATTAGGANSHAEGLGTTTTNSGEHAEGYYNKSTTKSGSTAGTLSSIGFGESGATKNVFEAQTDGKVYINGIGSFTGANATAGTNDIATVFGKKENIYDVMSVTYSAMPTSITSHTIVNVTNTPTNMDLTKITATNNKEYVIFYTAGASGCGITATGLKYIGELPTTTANKSFCIVLFQNTFMVAETNTAS